MLGTKPSSAKCAGQLMCLSGGLAIAAGLFAWATTPATVYWLAVELTVGVLWLGASTAVRAGRLLVIITATVLCVVSIFVTGAMLVLLSLFAQTGPGAIVMLGDVIRLPLTVLIIVFLWTPGSRRYFRYVREGGPVEPRPRWTLGRQRKESSLPRAAAPVSDEDVRVLRNFLQAGGQAEDPDSGLAAAALAEGAARRFGRRATRRQVADYVAEVLAGPGVPREDVWPRAAEKLLLGASRRRPARGINPQVRRATSGVLLRALAPADHANAGATEEFLAAARSRSDRSLPQAVRHVVRERHSGTRHWPIRCGAPGRACRRVLECLPCAL
jgi:hypothetical protein